MAINIDQAKSDIYHWLENFVEKPHPKLNNWAPCPFARKARLDKKFTVREGIIDPVKDCFDVVMENYDVIAYVYDPELFNKDQFNELVDLLNNESLLSRNMIALADHPDDIESVNGVIMNQGTWAICFLQDLNKLDAHAKLLASKGYYDSWPEDYLKTLFTGREDPRNV